MMSNGMYVFVEKPKGLPSQVTSGPKTFTQMMKLLGGSEQFEVAYRNGSIDDFFDTEIDTTPPF
jgi:hypothetical protein